MLTLCTKCVWIHGQLTWPLCSRVILSFLVSLGAAVCCCTAACTGSHLQLSCSALCRDSNTMQVFIFLHPTVSAREGLALILAFYTTFSIIYFFLKKKALVQLNTSHSTTLKYFYDLFFTTFPQYVKLGKAEHEDQFT